MTEDTWNVQADRLAAAWPSPPMDAGRRAVYFDVLRDLDDESVEAAVGALLGEDRSDMPPPGAIKTRARAMAVAAPGGSVGEASVGKESEAIAKERKREDRRATLAALAGLIGLFPVALWLGIWALKDRRRARAEGRKYENTATAVAALVLGTVSAIAVTGLLINFLSDRSSDDDRAPAAASLEPDAGNASADGLREAPLGEVFREGNFSFRVVRVASPAKILGFDPAAGAGFVRVTVEATNSSSQPVSGPFCAPRYDGVVLVDSSDRNYSPNLGSAELNDDPYCAAPLQPGLSRTYDLVHRVGRGAGTPCMADPGGRGRGHRRRRDLGPHGVW